MWRQDISEAAAARAKLSRDAVFWALKSVVIDRMSIARGAENLGIAWHTVNDAVLETGSELRINDPARLDGIRLLGAHEHVWSHTRGGSKYVTVITDLTPVRDGTGSSRLLDMVPGRSKRVFKTRLNQQEQTFRDGTEAVAMDGFTGFKTAAAEEIPQAVAVMDPFHVVALAGQTHWTGADNGSSRSPAGTAAARGILSTGSAESSAPARTSSPIASATV